MSMIFLRIQRVHEKTSRRDKGLEPLKQVIKVQFLALTYGKKLVGRKKTHFVCFIDSPTKINRC
jgi:hypothetical protein